MSASRPLVFAGLCLLFGCSPEVVDVVHFAPEDVAAQPPGEEEPREEEDAGAVEPSEDAGRPSRNDAGNPAPPSDAAAALPACERSDDCAQDRYCARAACGAKSGYCERIPSNCDARQDEVCGCDGVMYFNDCLRKAHRVGAVADSSFCNTLQCSELGPFCPPHAYCRLYTFDRTGGCRSPYRIGSCWVAPSACSAGSEGGDRYALCDGSGRCLSACEAIKSEQPHVAVKSCTQLPPWGPGPGGPTNMSGM